MPTHFEKFQRLLGLVRTAETRYASALVKAKAAGVNTPVRHKCFVCYHAADIDAVTDFVEQYEDVFIPRVVGASDSDHFNDPVNSTAEEYIKSQIREKYLWDSTVTLLFIGKCTWSRKYIDWEISASLRNDAKNKRSGLLAITPPDKSHNTLPTRFADNYTPDQLSVSYARYIYYPTTSAALRNAIQDAFAARDARASLVKNSRVLRQINSAC